MKKTDVNIKFDQIISLIKSATSQDIMLINETSPAMVRFLCEDNKFRTLVLTEDGQSTKITLTKTDDPEKALKDLYLFVKDLGGLSKEKEKEEGKKRSDLVAAQKLEAEEHRRKLDERIGNDKSIAADKIAQEAKKLEAAKAAKTKGSKKKTSKKKAVKKKVTKKTTKKK